MLRLFEGKEIDEREAGRKQKDYSGLDHSVRCLNLQREIAQMAGVISAMKALQLLSVRLQQ